MRDEETSGPLEPEELFRLIREKNPGDSCGDCWEGVGAYLGDGVWGDPKAFGIPGEYEFAFWAHPSRREV